MLCPHCRYLLFPLSCSGCLAFCFVYPVLPSYQVFFLILLPLLSISFQLAFLLRCTCRKVIDFPLQGKGLSYSPCMRKCHCFLEKPLAEQGCFIYPTTPSQKVFLIFAIILYPLEMRICSKRELILIICESEMSLIDYLFGVDTVTERSNSIALRAITKIKVIYSE